MAETSIRLICPNLKCRKILAVPESARGRVVVCSNCGTSVKVPDHRSHPATGNASPEAAKH